MTHHTIHTVVGHLQVLGLFLRRGDFIYKYLLMVHSHKVVRRDYLLFESSECGNVYLAYMDWVEEVTYVYSNMMPQCHVVNVINPKDIEKAVQAKSKLRRSTMQVLTGTKGVDKLRGRDKDNISLSKVFIETCHPKQSSPASYQERHCHPLQGCLRASWVRGVLEYCNAKQFRGKVIWLSPIWEESDCDCDIIGHIKELLYQI